MPPPPVFARRESCAQPIAVIVRAKYLAARLFCAQPRLARSMARTTHRDVLELYAASRSTWLGFCPGALQEARGHRAVWRASHQRTKLAERAQQEFITHRIGSYRRSLCPAFFKRRSLGVISAALETHLLAGPGDCRTLAPANVLKSGFSLGPLFGTLMRLLPSHGQRRRHLPLLRH